MFCTQLQLACSQKVFIFPSSAYGGYDLEFIDDIPTKFICIICSKVQRDPHLASCCGQHFCESCVKQWLQKAGNSPRPCPHCGVVDWQSTLNKEKMREIKEFQIRCKNSANGCDWVGELGELENHLNSIYSGCGYVKVKCSLTAYSTSHTSAHTSLFPSLNPYYSSSHSSSHTHISYASLTPTSTTTKPTLGSQSEGTCFQNPVTCGKEMERRFLFIHRMECKYRQYKCEYCGYFDTYDAIAGAGKFRKRFSKVHPNSKNHYLECDHFPLECVNKCGEMEIKRKDMSFHQDVCPFELLKCPFTHCTNHSFRINLETHKEMCEFRPFSCEYCGSSGTFSSIAGKGEIPLKEKPHYHVCEQYPLDCPNQCSAKNIKRKDIPSHRDKCPLEQLDCPFKYAQCPNTVLRKDMEDHCQRNVPQHLLLVAKLQQELNDKLMGQYLELSDKVDELMRTKRHRK